MSQLADIPAATEFVSVGSEKSTLQRFFAFPNPVNEYAARFTAGIVVLLSLAAILSQAVWLVAVIFVGFALRLAFGPRISPAALLSVKVLAPLLGAPRLVPGPPKRFAQGMGAAMSLASLALLLAGAAPAGWMLIGVLIVAASLESFVGLCLGCLIFGVLQRRGFIPESVCVECANISLRDSLRRRA